LTVPAAFAALDKRKKMEIQIQAKGLPRAAHLRQYAGARLKAVLSRFAGTIEDVSVRMYDINGPERGGVDKLCRAVIRFKNNSLMVVEELGSDMTRVIDRVTERLTRSLARQTGGFAMATG
jgi:ribosome-associated translation inhibitor RaiA